ncbi:hypothetical protein HYV80_01305 [Candidatus Woesearchaeota archaeon]|nr:hypothetical protein [Candidatus Woesearchaeota archaeon]
MKVIVIMTGTTTIPVSKEFHEWLKSKGKKGESYENIIKRLINPNGAQDKPDDTQELKDSDSSADDLLES